MTYQEIKTQLKALKEQGHVIPALNSKKEVLEAALNAILATLTTEETTAFVTSRNEICEAGSWVVTSTAPVAAKKAPSAKAIEARKANGKKLAAYNAGHLDFVIEENDPAPVETIEAMPQAEPTPTTSTVTDYDTTPSVEIAPIQRPSGWQLLRLEITDDIRFVGEVLLYAIAALKFIAFRTAPYVKKALNTALRIAVYAFVIFQEWLLPKLLIRAYLIGIWGVSIALKIVHSRRWSIA